MSEVEKNKKIPAGENTEFELRGMCFNKEINKDMETVDYNSFIPEELKGTVSIKVSSGGKPEQAPEIG